MHHAHQLIQAALWKLGWSISIVIAIAYFIRNILMYINSKGIEDDLNKGIFLVAVFGVVIILLASSSSSATSCQLVSALKSRCTCQWFSFHQMLVC